jgi:hypothetical protein
MRVDCGEFDPGAGDPARRRRVGALEPLLFAPSRGSRSQAPRWPRDPLSASASSIQTGAWSLDPASPRTSRAIPAANRTIIAGVELSQSSWLVGGIVPGIERQPRKKLEPSPERLLALLHHRRDEAVCYPERQCGRECQEERLGAGQSGLCRCGY